MTLFSKPISLLRLLRPSADSMIDEPPLRAQVLGVDHLAEYAYELAQRDALLPSGRPGRRLLPRLDDNRRALTTAQQKFARQAQGGHAVPPTAEWLLDNFYIVQDQLREIRQDLSSGYYRELPKLANGAYVGYPRVYGLALELIAHTDSRLDAAVITRFVQAYQTVAPLNLGELWAVPIMLRLGLVENVRRLVADALVGVEQRAQADLWADRLLQLHNRPATEFVIDIGELAKSHREPSPVFVVQLLQRLRDQDPSIAPAIRWLEQRLAEQGTTIEEVVRSENQHSAMNRVSVGNAITSMRALAALDWQTLIEETSLVERVLRGDPARVYPRMDFATRDRYRHVVERLSRYSRQSQAEVARRALDLATEGQHTHPTADQRPAHVGYYLIGAGVRELEAQVGYRPDLATRGSAWVLNHPVRCYLGTIFLVTLLLVGGLVWYASAVGAGMGLLLLLALLSVVPMSAIAVSATNWTFATQLPTNPPPKLELTEIPPDYRTMVLVPALINDKSGIQQLLKGLELRFLANRDPHLHFALLGDFADSPLQVMPEDAHLIETAAQRVRELNARYGGDKEDRFYFFHRRRCWNPQENVWMGWERKRGKLLEFNRLLRGATDTNFIVQLGDPTILPQVKYVITLDADTRLPIGAGKRLVGALAHPLNHARLDPRTQRVVEGYGIIQPRTAITPQASAASRFAEIYSGDTGLDPYTAASSLVYQDLFGTGVYVGKAIYDVDAFQRALAGRFPENRVLSHDLLEGAFARVGAATDIQLLEDLPPDADAYAQRQHRWIRGDWQIATWLLPWMPDAAGRYIPNPLPLVERWKILDNLRHSLVIPLMVALLLAGWTLLPGAPLFWTVVALSPLWFLAFRSIAASAGVHPAGETWGGYLSAVAREAAQSGARLLLSLTLLLYDTRLNLGAIARVLVRLMLTHRHLLEWIPQAALQHGQAKRLGDYILRMWSIVALALVMFILILVFEPPALWVAVPILVLWVVSPLIAFWVSQPLNWSGHPPPQAARRELRMTARRIWRYFEEFAGPLDNWLPPDNFQVGRNPPLAHQTSPTNIGLLLLSSIAAHDFGFISTTELAERLEYTFDTLDRLECYRGHLYNWYNTATLQPLLPKYISTADSGNLAASLIAVKHACLQIAAQPVLSPAARVGLQDTLAVLEAALKEIEPHPDAAVQVLQQMQETIQQLHALMAGQDDPLTATAQAGPANEGLSSELLAQLRQSAAALAAQEQRLEQELGGEKPEELRFWIERFGQEVTRLQDEVRQTRDGGQETGVSNPPSSDPRPPSPVPPRLRLLAHRADELLSAMDFSFLYDSGRGIFSVGYNLTANYLDTSYFDLLASEARLASFVAIAQGQVSEKHWFQLSRPLTRTAGRLALLSWGGTMFEFLLPPLLTRTVPQTLLYQTFQAVVKTQIAYARTRGVPWGVSESGFYAFDLQSNYQYRLFGVPQLALKRELSDDLVIAPYATFLALPILPERAWLNLQRLVREGGAGPYGYYEAIDYTPTRVPQGERAGIVRQYMSHHQGFSLVAIDNLLNGAPMQTRFEDEPSVAAAMVLLEERIPRHAPLIEPQHQTRPAAKLERPPAPAQRHFTTPHTPEPRAQLLSNGNFTTVITNAGGGYSTYKDWMMTRWRPDLTRDDWGSFIYLKDLSRGRVWSVAYQPTRIRPDHYQVTFSSSRAEFQRRDGEIETRLEIIVSPEDDAEVRQLTLTNHGAQPHALELTSYAEVVLDTFRSDLAQPAFSKLFVESEFLTGCRALLFKRRPRAQDQPTVWAVHLLASDAPGVQVTGYESDRCKFLGRGHTVANPDALQRPLSNTAGAVLDPIMSLRSRIHLAAGQTVRVSFITGACESRERALALVDEYADMRDLERTLELASVHSQILLRHLGVSPDQEALFQRLASRVLYPDPALRAKPDVLARNVRGQSGLWAYGISGDYPIVLVRVSAGDELNLVRELLLAHEYWQMKHLTVDLVILNEHPSTYGGELRDRIQGMIDTSLSRPWLDKPGGVFLRQRDQLPDEDWVLLETVARVVLDGELGNLANQFQRGSRHRMDMGVRGWGLGVGDKSREANPERRRATVSQKAPITSPPLPLAPNPQPLTPIFDNGFGGFTQDGKEYVIQLDGAHWTPAPWINVLANPGFGCLVSESALGYTWAVNSQTNKLTPWSNDPISDPPGEVIYLLDEATQETWTPTPLPIREVEPYQVRHGAGYSVVEHTSHALMQELLIFVPKEEPVKVLRLKLRNLSARPRQLRATFYAEWVLGVTRQEAQFFILTEKDMQTGALLAHNSYNSDFVARVAFAAVGPDRRGTSFTADRVEFLGRNGSLVRPPGLLRPQLSGQVGVGHDPCAAIQARVELGPHAEQELVFLLGEGQDRDEARALIERYRDPNAVQSALDAVKAQWDELLGAVQVKTPDPALDLLLNRWLLYQVLACRVWGRTAFYQAGGAYGFRDQLQDVMALVLAAPQLTREQIVRAAQHQFVEGDVQHWWHPPVDAGIRTRISDDYLWLPFVTQHYIETTGDHGILDEPIPFLQAPLLQAGQVDWYGKPQAEAPALLYEHCCRALDHGLRFGEHGLPLMGTGDWNDGMNRVGDQGKGESVWLGWFLLVNLMAFLPICEQRGDHTRAGVYRAQARRLAQALEEHGWDGEWYRRAYFDDGQPLGSAENPECKIDSIAQSWAILSQAVPAERRRAALEAVEKYLVREQDQLLLLLTPPFDQFHPDPGYIRGYIPGTRENGGQYTHAALWVVLAYIRQGNGKRAAELLSLLNPINHARTPAEVARYKVEPYVIAADVYSQPQHLGRGGWTWYTGSAGWMYRIGVEELLGLKPRGEAFTVEPCIPPEWPGYQITYHDSTTRYEIIVENPYRVCCGVAQLELDGVERPDHMIPLAHDGALHRVRVVLGAAS